MNSSARYSGYTIIEVMIFLAVSGFMFVLAAAFVNGKQANAEFKQGMASTASNIQSAINTVANGFYPQDNQLDCTAGATGIPTFPTGGATEGQGSNGGCVFLGKVIQIDFMNTAKNDAGYNIYTIAARQYKPGANPDNELSTSLADASPTVVASLVDSNSLEWGLQFTGMYKYASDDTAHTGAHASVDSIGFLGGLGSYSAGSNDQLQSGSQSVTMVVFRAALPDQTVFDVSQTADRDRINNGIKQSNVVNQPNVVICFAGGRGQHGSITIGGGIGQRLNIDAETGNNVVGVCRT
jgi:hypothetical protein